ncbi:unnamed protein product [Peronospora destructor]|uniref:FYVE zinc finger domain-containing protein n=1 Tax=Peronospora destructor TaxID=86335 RepID=A0AAV0VC73_9STRA|nr:unnamed protein product [Peronospora destructor]
MTKGDVHKHIALAKDLRDDALNKAHADRQVGNIDYRTWKQLGSHAGFKRLTTMGDNSRDVHYRLQGHVRASLDNLMDVIYADSTAQVMARREILYNDSLDAQTLCVLKERNAENMHEHISIRWEAINLSNNSPIYQRDMCFLEFTGVATDADGIPVGFMIKQALERNECVSLKESHGLTRHDFTEVMLLRPKDNASHTEFILNGAIRHPQNLPGWLVQSFLGIMATCLSKLPIIVQERLLTRLPVIKDWQFVPHSTRKNCHVCASKFGMLSKKISCRSCGEVACKSCIVTRTVGEKTKFCTKSSSSSMHSKTGAMSVPRTRVDMRLLDDAKARRRNCSIASTASKTSFENSNSYYKNRCSSDTARYGSLNEEVIETLDTTQMTRPGRGLPPVLLSQSNQLAPTAEAVEDSIAHQRHLLKKMLSQAKIYQQQ